MGVRVQNRAARLPTKEKYGPEWPQEHPRAGARYVEVGVESGPGFFITRRLYVNHILYILEGTARACGVHYMPCDLFDESRGMFITVAVSKDMLQALIDRA